MLACSIGDFDPPGRGHARDQWREPIVIDVTTSPYESSRKVAISAASFRMHSILLCGTCDPFLFLMRHSFGSVLVKFGDRAGALSDCIMASGTEMDGRKVIYGGL